MRAQTSNGILFLLLFVAGYLSVVTIAALPTQLEDVTAARSELELLASAIQSEDRTLPASIEAAAQQDPFEALVELMEAPNVRGRTAAVRADMAFHQAQRSRLIDEVSSARAFWSGRVTRAGDHAIALFAENVDRKGNVERREHATALLAWYDQLLGEAEREVTECLGSSAVADADVRAWVADHVRALPPQREQAVARVVRWDRALEQCEQRWAFGSPPARAELGRRYGPLQPMAAWLVRTESMSLMTCVGLLGFGLLGAAASSFIRDQPAGCEVDASQSRPLVSDLAAVVVRGLVAAVVVFLAVKGGLSVFAVDAPDPNPYVLLLTCLVAAIFSEPVFAWARGRIGLTSAPAPPVEEPPPPTPESPAN